MSKNIDQVFIANPITSNTGTDLMYFGQSPYGAGNDAAMTYTNFAAQFALSTAIINPAHGGTGINNGTSTLTLGGNTAFSGAFTFTGTITAATSVTFPTAGTLATTSQLPTPAALTSGNDTNVTLTLGGTPATALLQAASITAGWTGTLSLARGGTAAALTASNGGIFYSTGSAGAILAGTATAAQFLASGASTTPQWSTNTWPLTDVKGDLHYASATNTISGLAIGNTGQFLTIAAGLPAWSTATLPSTAGTSRTLLVSNGTNFVNTTETYAVPGTSGNVLTSDGTNWTSAAPTVSTILTTKGDILGYTTTEARVPVAVGDGKVLQVSSGASAGIAYSTPTYPSASGGAGTILRSDGTNNLYTTTTYPNTNAINTIMYASSANVLGVISAANSGVLVSSSTGVPSMLAAGTTGQVLQASSAGTPAWSTPTYPSASGSAGVLLRSDGTNYVATTSTYPNTNAINTLLYASSANVMSALATANTGVLTTNGSGVPSITSKIVAANLPTGTMFNFQQTQLATTTTTTGASFADVTGMSVAITPTSSSNSILVRVVMYVASVDVVAAQIVRTATAIGIGTTPGSRTACGGSVYTSAGGAQMTCVVMEWLDSPATTSATTYKVQTLGITTNTTVYINRTPTDTNSAIFPRTASTISVCEIST